MLLSFAGNSTKRRRQSHTLLILLEHLVCHYEDVDKLTLQRTILPVAVGELEFIVYIHIEKIFLFLTQLTSSLINLYLYGFICNILSTQITSVLSDDSTSMSFLQRDSSVDEIPSNNNTIQPQEAAQPVTITARTASQITKDETKSTKILTRIFSGLIMISTFILILLSGHVYVCALVFILEILLFRELVTVRYNIYFNRIDSTIPLFRTTQWCWFFTSIVYTYLEFIIEMLIKSNYMLHTPRYLEYVKLSPIISFSLYTGTFVLTIATMQTGHIKFQLNQLCWTIVVLCLTVGQLKYIMHNIYNGLIWFTLPILLVITNDIMAYVSGMMCGRKFIHRSFVKLSPNKTWEGFIGGGIFTVIVGWYLSRFLSKWTWMTCPTNQVSLLPDKLECKYLFCSLVVACIVYTSLTFLPHSSFCNSCNRRG